MRNVLLYSDMDSLVRLCVWIHEASHFWCTWLLRRIQKAWLEQIVITAIACVTDHRRVKGLNSWRGDDLRHIEVYSLEVVLLVTLLLVLFQPIFGLAYDWIDGHVWLSPVVLWHQVAHADRLLATLAKQVVKLTLSNVARATT
jgi:hypothetical protein